VKGQRGMVGGKRERESGGERGRESGSEEERGRKRYKCEKKKKESKHVKYSSNNRNQQSVFNNKEVPTTNC
jgi:hypothetical protein